MLCKKCGNEINDDSKYCPLCGEVVKSDVLEYGQRDQANNINKPPKALKGLLVFVGVCIVITLLAFIIVGGEKPIYDVALGDTIDTDTLYPVREYEIFAEGTGNIYVSYSTRDLEIGETITIKWYTKMTSPHKEICTETVTNDYEEQIGYSSCSYDWIWGAYKVEFIVDGKAIVTKEFDVE